MQRHWDTLYYDPSDGKAYYDWSSGLDLEENDDSNLYFSPEKGNVAFASASDGWGFRVSTFASLYQSKMGIRKDVLQKTLWGDYHLNTKAKQIQKGAYEKGKRPLFVTFILESIWNVYKAVLLQRNNDKIDQIVTSLKLKIAPRDARSTDYRVHLFAVFNAWIPIASALLDMACEILPSPLDLSSEKINSLLCSGVTSIEQLPRETQALTNNDKIDQIVTSLKLKIAPRDARSTDYRVHLFAVFNAWIPIASALLDMACEILPSPLDLSSEKINSLLCSGVTSIEQLPRETQALTSAFRACSGGEDDPVIVYVSKMISVLPDHISCNKHRPLTDAEIERRRDAARLRNQQKLSVNFNPELTQDPLPCHVTQSVVRARVSSHRAFGPVREPLELIETSK
eukprot:sb/3465403/